MTATLTLLDGAHMRLAVARESYAEITAVGTAAEIPFDVLLLALPILSEYDRVAAAVPPCENKVAIVRIGYDMFIVRTVYNNVDCALRSQLASLLPLLRSYGEFARQSHAPLSSAAAPVESPPSLPASPAPSTSVLASTAATTPPLSTRVVTPLVPRAKKQAPKMRAKQAPRPRTRLQTGAPVNQPERLGQQVVRQALLSRRRKVIELTSDDDKDSDFNDESDDSDIVRPRIKRTSSLDDFIVPDDDIEDDDATQPPPPLDDVEESNPTRMFERMRNNNMDERAAFTQYLAHIKSATIIPEDAVAVRRLAAYPGQLASSIARSGAWRPELVKKLTECLMPRVDIVHTPYSDVCDVCRRRRTITRTLVLWYQTRPMPDELHCGACCADRAVVYSDLHHFHTRMTTFARGNNEDACWEYRRALIERGMAFADEAPE